MKDELSDRVFLENLKIRARHGVYDSERESDQDFLVDISAQIDTRPAAASDSLEDAINYGVFREIAREVFAGQPHHLIESLAEAIAQKILQDERIRAVSVRIRKPEIYQDCTPGISITRTRA